jgi:hypothetical protein
MAGEDRPERLPELAPDDGDDPDDLAPEKPPREVAEEAIEECKEHASVGRRQRSALLYVLRLEGRNLPRPVYKVGFTTLRGSGFNGAPKRTLANRIMELNNEFDCCIGHNPDNIIVVMLAEAVGRPEELPVHKLLSKFRVDVPKKFGGFYRELYEIRPEVYDGFFAFCKESLDVEPWASTLYELGNDWGETWKEEIITEPKAGQGGDAEQELIKHSAEA